MIGEYSRSWRSNPALFRDTELSFLSAILLWISFPPCGWHLLAWMAPIGWTWIAYRRSHPTRSTYTVLWLSGVLHWALMLQGIRLAHWANYFGLIPLAAYLGIYTPLFVGATRIAVHRLECPLILCAPLVWLGLELARGYMFTGFAVGLLGHAQFRQTVIIQVADMFGAYGLSALTISVCSAIVKALSALHRPQRIGWLALAVAIYLAAFAYGMWRQELPRQVLTESDVRQPLKVAIIQGSIDTVLGESAEQKRANLNHYWALTELACRTHPDVHLVVWPESAFGGDLPEFVVQDDLRSEFESRRNENEKQRFEELKSAFQVRLQRFSRIAQRMISSRPGIASETEGSLNSSSPQFVVGSVTIDVSNIPKTYNSVLQVDASGSIGGRYYKMHRVPFGEYLPFASWIPWLYSSGITPLSGGLEPGKSPMSFLVHGWRLSPSICFESTVPHVITGHVRKLTDQGTPPDALINVTDDGWFRGSSILDLHLACGVFRAVENRRPLLIAANTGISAAIDGNGHIILEGARRQTATLVSEVPFDQRSSLYLWWGDVPGTICVVVVVGLFVMGYRDRRRHKSTGSQSKSKK